MYVIDGIVFEQYDHEYNLTHNHIFNFIKDSKGFLWLGTPEGLNILDGKTVKIFKGYINKNNTFKGKDALSLFEDSKGNIFCGTRAHGLNIYNRSSGVFTNINEPLLSTALSKSIKSIVQLNNQNYALLTEKEIIFFTLDKSEKASNVSRIELSLIDKEWTRKLLVYENYLLLNTSKRLLKISNDKDELLFSHKWLKDCKIRNNKLWVNADESLGYFTDDLKSVTWIDYKLQEGPNGENDYFLDFDVTLNNELWIGTKYKKLVHLKIDQNAKPYYKKEINGKVESRKIFIDSLNNVFIATSHRQGLVKIDGRQHQYEYIKLPKGNEEVYRHNFNEDNDGKYWISGNPGVFIYNTKTKSYHRFKNGTYKGLENRKINHQIKDRNGKVWFGTSNGIATYNFDSGTFDFYGHDVGGFWDSFTIYLQTDSSNNLWYKTKNRINKINNLDRTHEFFEVEGIEVMFIDSDDSLWVTIKDVGLVKYSIKSGVPNVIKHYFTSDDFLNFGTQHIVDDKYGRLWISSDNGVYIYNPKEEEIVYHLNRNNALKYDFLYAVVKDNRGNFWIPQSKYPAVCISYETFEVIDTSPLWMRREANTEEYAGIAHIEKNGKAFTEGTGGFFVFHPDSLTVNPKPPDFALEQIKINGQTQFDNFLGAEGLEFNDLKYDNNNIDISLKEVNPQTSYTTQYAYRLTGSSNEWQFTKTLGSLNFSALSPNNYEFQVKSTNDGKYWSSPFTLATFNILPPWWQSTYAYLAYALITGLLVYVLYRFQLNKKLAENEALKLKEVDDFKNEFYQNITHEFRTPLTVILGASENLKDKTSIIIKRNANQLLGLVNELLNIGQVETNVSKLEIQTQDVVSFSKYCMESLQSLAEQKKINLNFLANKDKILMDFDTNKFQLILNNLLSNAIKFTPESGNITLEINEQSTNILIKVIDNGVGIAKQDLEKVFERYYQTDSREKSNGSGIGLSLTKELVKLMNGSIHASNNPKKGTCFTMTFPLTTKAKPNNLDNKLVTNLSTEALNDHEHIILVIEDNKDVMEYIVSILPNSYKIITAIDGKQGVEKALELIPDIIISDVMMPFKDGYEVCDTLKSDEKTNHIPIVLLTAKADMQSKIAGIIKGADAYLGKPFNKAELLAQLNNLIRLREKLKTKYSSEINEVYTGNRKLTDVFLNKLQNLVLKKIDDENYGINEICSDLGISRTQLHRKIKAITGMSSSIFIREIRLKEGYKLLLNSNLTVSEVAYSVGFSDPSYFSKLFTQKYGKSPSSVE